MTSEKVAVEAMRSVFRLIIGILVGISSGILALAALAGCMLLGLIVYYTILNPGMGIDIAGGGQKAVLILFPAVVYVLPLTDGMLCPGILTGILAHRMRSFYSLLILGCLAGVFFSLTIWITYAVFDPILLCGFMALETLIALTVCGADILWMRFFSKKTGGRMILPS